MTIGSIPSTLECLQMSIVCLPGTRIHAYYILICSVQFGAIRGESMSCSYYFLRVEVLPEIWRVVEEQKGKQHRG